MTFAESLVYSSDQMVLCRYSFQRLLDIFGEYFVGLFSLSFGQLMLLYSMCFFPLCSFSDLSQLYWWQATDSLCSLHNIDFWSLISLFSAFLCGFLLLIDFILFSCTIISCSLLPCTWSSLMHAYNIPVSWR